MPLTASPARILVVEDDLTVSEVVTRHPEREGFVVELACDGEFDLLVHLMRHRGVAYRFEP